jgi:hypothetical protein
LLDSGADDTVFPDWVAKLIGVDLSSAPTASASGIGLTRSRLQLAEVTLRLTTSGEFHEWKARVGFTSTPLKQPLLGFAGFMQYYTASFFGDLEEVELTTNSKYPGS